MNKCIPSRSHVGLKRVILFYRGVFLTVFISPLSAAVPTAQADAIAMNPGQKASIAVLANDTNGSTPIIVQSPQFGTAVPVAYSRVLYTHTTGSPNRDTFTYRATNSEGQSAPTTVTVNFTNSLRLANANLNVPAGPPVTAYQIVDAFGSLAFNQPVCLATPPTESQRLFVCEKGGLLRVIRSVTATAPTAATFLNLPALLATRGEAVSTNSEQGLLGLAFHPDYATNRYFYLFYSVDKNPANGSSPIYERVSRFTTRADNPNLADTSSERVLIEQEDQSGNHNGGDLHFGPVDKYLYISLGDEGAQNDTHNNSQHLSKDFFSAILRIDVDKKPVNLEPNPHPNPAESDPPTNAIPRYETAPGSGVFKAAYSIPKSNPFVPVSQGGSWDGTFNGTAVTAGNRPYVRTEFWAVGLRNPWRFSFDSVTSALWVGDVGGDTREEVDVVIKGGNYGWNFREGLIARPDSPAPPAGFSSSPPVYDYRHSSDATGDPKFKGNSITGGFVYRGVRLRNLVGAYVFADYVSGNVWTLRRYGTAPATVKRIAGEGGIVAFGADPANGDVLMANINSGRIRRLTGSSTASSYPSTLGATGLFADLSDLSPNPGLLPYKVNLPFWSDHAVKRRWFIIPDASSKMTWSRDANWSYPTGQIWVKHFDLPLTRSNPPLATDPQAPVKRVETRLLVKTASGSYGVSYRWNDAGSEATLVPDEGADFDLNVTQNGQPYTQHWHIPSRAECSICHTGKAGHSLSMNTRQLNLSNTINTRTGNQLNLLKYAGYFSNVPDSPNTLPRHLGPDETGFSPEARVRSYLAVNCAYCHQAGGTAAPAVWDGRPELTLAQTGLINGHATNDGGSSLNKLVVPGDLAHSVIYNRVALTNGFSRMPPLASSELDQRSISLLAEWIGQVLPASRTYEQWSAEKLGLNLAAMTLDLGSNDDPDCDGRSNMEEFIANTDPLKGDSFFTAKPGISSNRMYLNFMVPPNRSGQVETSMDLETWKLWDVPGNQGLPQAGGAVTLQGPVANSCEFFRVRLHNN